MRQLPLLALSMATVWAQQPGLRPRADANSYPVHVHIANATIGAVALSPAQVKSAFGSDTYKGYIVVEVAVFPDANQQLDLSPRDFMLKIGESGKLLRSAAPSTIALSIDEKNNPSHPPDIPLPVSVTTTSTVAYDSAGTYNPNTGKRQGAVYMGTEVDVSQPGNRPVRQNNSKGRSFDDMEAELKAKALPETRVAHPVAGYIYFIPPRKKVSGIYHLDYLNDSGRVQLAVPAPAH